MIKAVLAIDQREQRPYTFEACKPRQVLFDVRRGFLHEGDYAAYLPDDFSPAGTCIVERKSHKDLLSSLTHERARFERELERLRPYGFKAIVIEADLPAILKGLPHSRVNPRAIIASLIAYQQRFDVHVCYCSTRQLAECFTYRTLERWVRDGAAARKRAEGVAA